MAKSAAMEVGTLRKRTRCDDLPFVLIRRPKRVLQASLHVLLLLFTSPLASQARQKKCRGLNTSGVQANTVETDLDEIKTYLLLGCRTLCCQTPQGVEQEFYGLLAYFAVRTLMYAAALQADRDPDELSFVQTIHATQRA